MSCDCRVGTLGEGMRVESVLTRNYYDSVSKEKKRSLATYIIVRFHGPKSSVRYIRLFLFLTSRLSYIEYNLPANTLIQFSGNTRVKALAQ